MTGYQPDFDFLKSIGINIKDNDGKSPTYNKANYETNIKKIFLAGVVCGGMNTGEWFIENARIHAPKIIERIKEYESSI
jgi:thioredoxin reductase (NADPH)